MITVRPVKLLASCAAALFVLIATGCSTDSKSHAAKDAVVETLEERDGYSRVFLHKPTEQGVRDILVQVTWKPGASTKRGVLLIGGYRTDSSVVENDPVRSWMLESSGYMVVRIGFPHMNMGSDVDFKDIANHPQDVEVVLDYLRTNSSNWGALDDGHVAWLGVSMGGITGLFIESERDPVVKLSGVVSIAGFLPQRQDGFTVPEYNLEDVAPTLLTASQTDETIPYSLTVGTFNVMRSNSDQVTLLSRQSGLHGAVADCAAMNERLKAFVLEALSGTPHQGSDVGGSCMTEGVLEGGTTGFGAATPLVGAGAR